MRPVRLSMTAFGPYREVEHIDFGELGPNRVFLIHGETGAGKTTVLDAMVFALYGDTSGGERSGRQMRCESASPGLATEVIFDFALGEREYRLRRRPGQETAALRGLGMVQRAAECVLWERTGVDDGEEGKLLGSKSRDVDSLVRSLLGFSSDQFRQVVMLPQGRFRDLLAAGSDEREDILRQLFRTEEFSALEQRLAERAKKVKEDWNRLQAERGAVISAAGAEDDSHLAALLERAARLHESAQRDLEAVERRAEEARRRLQLAEAADEARRKLEQARQVCAELEERAPLMKEREDRLADSTRAEKAQAAAITRDSARGEVSRAEAECLAAASKLEAAVKTEADATTFLAAEQSREEERREARDAVKRLEDLQKTIAQWRAAVEACATAQTGLAEVREDHEAAASALVLAGDELEGATDAAARTRHAAERLSGTEARLHQAKQMADVCQKLEDTRKTRAQAEQTLRRTEHETEQAEIELARAKRICDRAETAWRLGRAATLAQGLTAGDPCPVCGSEEHPAPARASADGCGDAELEAARQALESAREAERRARERVNAVEREVDLAREREAGLLHALANRRDLSPEKAREFEQTCRLEYEREEAESGELERLEGAAAEALRSRQVAEDRAAQALLELQKSTAVFERADDRRSFLESSVPGELRPPGALEANLEKAKTGLVQLAEAFTKASDQHRDSREHLVKWETTAADAEKARVGATRRLGLAETAFADKLKALGFTDGAEWSAALLEEELCRTLARELSDYQDQLQQARGWLQQAEKAVQDSPLTEAVAGAKVSCDEAEAELKRLLDVRSIAKAQQGKLQDATGRLAELDASAERIEAVFQTAGRLAEVANGQAGGDKISFQRWVLGVYLDEVLVAASRRLYRMSRGRYRLVRQRAADDGRRASGLDLAVFDEFSGSTRSAVTLSGGESFLAALSLALGLAQTVQERSGATRLETIFVDEGFGALDPDALELSIDALMDLQGDGRLVGVISHVPELRQVINARLEVTGGPEGSRTSFIVP